MSGRWRVAIALGVVLGAGTAVAQDVEQLPGATHVVRAPEIPVAGLVKRGADTVALTLAHAVRPARNCGCMSSTSMASR